MWTLLRPFYLQPCNLAVASACAEEQGILLSLAVFLTLHMTVRVTTDIKLY